MFKALFLISALLGFASFFWAATGAAKLMRINVRDRAGRMQAPLSDPFDAMLMPGLGAEGLSLRRRVWMAFLTCIMCVVVAVTATHWM